MPSKRSGMQQHCNEAELIEKYLGTSYFYVRVVAENINAIIANSLPFQEAFDRLLEELERKGFDAQLNADQLLESVQRQLQEQADMFGKEVDFKVSESYRWLDETFNGLVHDSEFTIRLNDHEASIKSIETIIASNEETAASKFDQMTVNFNENSVKIGELQRASSNHERSIASIETSMEANFKDNQAKFTELTEIIATNEEVRAKRDTELSGSISDNTALINSNQEINVTNFKAVAESINNITVEVEGFNASITEVYKAIAEVDSATTIKITQLKSELDKQTGELKAEITDLSKTVVELDKAVAEQMTELKTNLDDKESLMSLTNLAKSTSVESLVMRDVTLKASMDLREAVFSLQQLAQVTESEVRVFQNATLAASLKVMEDGIVADLSAEIKNTQETLTNEIEAVASSVETLKSEVTVEISGNKVEIDKAKKDLEATKIDLESNKTELETNKKGLEANKAELENSKKELEAELLRLENDTTLDSEQKAREIQATKDELNKTNTNLNTTNQNLNKTNTELDKTNTELGKTNTKINNLEMDLDTTKRTLTAEIESTKKTVATVDGKVEALVTLKTVTSTNGGLDKAIAGIEFGSDGTTGNFKVIADNFYVVSSDGRREIPMFTTTITNGVTKMTVNGDLMTEGDVIAKGLVKGATIEGTTVKGGNIQGGQLNIANRFKVDTNGNVSIRSDQKE